VAAQPEHHGDGAEHQQHDGRHQQRAGPHIGHRRADRALDALREGAAVDRLVGEGLHGAHGLQGLVGIGAHVGDAVLGGARQPADAAAEEDDGQHDKGHDQQCEARELRARNDHHDGAAGE